mgnify:CR=1 FL=1
MKNVFFIAIIGPDGVGKTTIANGITERTSRDVVHRAANFEILPTFSEIKYNFRKFFFREKDKYIRNTDEYKGFHSGMKQKPNSFIKSTVLIFWYTLDYCLGHLYLRKVKKEKKIILFARYYYDYYFQISNRNYPHYLLRFFECFIPKPQLVFYLNRDASAIYDKKPELSLHEITRQQQLISSLSKTRSNFIEIDATCGIQHTIDQIVTRIEKDQL